MSPQSQDVSDIQGRPELSTLVAKVSGHKCPLIHVQILMFYVMYTEVYLRGYIHERGLLMLLIKGKKQAKCCVFNASKFLHFLT